MTQHGHSFGHTHPELVDTRRALRGRRAGRGKAGAGTTGRRRAHAQQAIALVGQAGGDAVELGALLHAGQLVGEAGRLGLVAEVARDRLGAEGLGEAVHVDLQVDLVLALAEADQLALLYVTYI